MANLALVILLGLIASGIIVGAGWLWAVFSLSLVVFLASERLAVINKRLRRYMEDK